MVADLTPVPANPKVQGFTGEIILRTRPKTYRKVVELLAMERSAISIAKECRVSAHSVEAIRKRQATPIAERKSELVTMMSDIAHLGSGRVADTIGKASTRDAIIGTGVAVDKMLALLGQTPAVQIANVIMPSEADRNERRALHDKLDLIAAKLNA